MEIEWVSYQMSASEEWRLLDSRGEVVSSGSGQDCGELTVTENRYLVSCSRNLYSSAACSGTQDKSIWRSGDWTSMDSNILL